MFHEGTAGPYETATIGSTDPERLPMERRVGVGRPRATVVSCLAAGAAGLALARVIKAAA